MFRKKTCDSGFIDPTVIEQSHVVDWFSLTCSLFQLRVSQWKAHWNELSDKLLLLEHRDDH